MDSPKGPFHGAALTEMRQKIGFRLILGAAKLGVQAIAIHLLAAGTRETGSVTLTVFPAFFV